MLKYGVPLGPIIFLIYIDDLYHVIKCCEVHHFTDDANLLKPFNSSTEILNRLVSLDMNYLSVWLNPKKIYKYTED